jgi:hypothetical protein
VVIPLYAFDAIYVNNKRRGEERRGEERRGEERRGEQSINSVSLGRGGSINGGSIGKNTNRWTHWGGHIGQSVINIFIVQKLNGLRWSSQQKHDTKNQP